jgi:hypothetical protein
VQRRRAYVRHTSAYVSREQELEAEVQRLRARLAEAVGSDATVIHDPSVPPFAGRDSSLQLGVCVCVCVCVCMCTRVCIEV